MRMAALLIFLLFNACAQSSNSSQVVEVGYEPGDPNIPPTAFTSVRWKAVLIAGDHSIANFDRAVNALDHILAGRGVQTRILLSAADGELARGKKTALPDNIEEAFQRLDLRQGDACLLFMTSHGDRNGFQLSRKAGLNRTWTHREFADVLNKYCGWLPSVAIVSSCYSGGFINGKTIRPNIILLTAARWDRTSFGCGTETEYTYYDDCLLRAWPKSQSWEGLARLTGECVDEKERRGNMTPSKPQVFLGRYMRGLRLP